MYSSLIQLDDKAENDNNGFISSQEEDDESNKHIDENNGRRVKTIGSLLFESITERTRFHLFQTYFQLIDISCFQSKMRNQEMIHSRNIRDALFQLFVFDC